MVWILSAGGVLWQAARVAGEYKYWCMRAEFREFTGSHYPKLIGPGTLFAALLAHLIDPFGGIELSFLKRFLFWSLVILLACGIAHWAGNFVHSRCTQVQQALLDVVVIVLIAALFTPSVWLLTWILHAHHGVEAPGVLTVSQFGALFAMGLLVLRRAFPEVEPQPAVTQDAPARPRLCRRLPNTFDGQILRLTVRDHNVDVVTTEGTITIRSRFGDAIDEMDPVKGHCTHRSHWVTEDAIESVEREAGKIHIRLINGDLVPVSRKYRPVLEEAGVI